MSWLRTIVTEVWGLFVDDGAFALATLTWLGLMWLVVPRIGLPSAWAALLLFVGLAGILVESVLRYSRRRRVSGAK